MMKRYLKWILLTLALTFAFAIYKSEKPRLKELEKLKSIQGEKNNLPDDPNATYTSEIREDSAINVLSEYSVLDIGLNKQWGFNVFVRIDKKLSENELKLLAQTVKKSINPISDKGIVFFYLPEMLVNNGAWASVHFLPEPKIEIIGQTISDEKRIQSSLKNIDGAIGLWSDEGMQGDIIIRIRKDKKFGYVFEHLSSVDFNQSELAIPLKKQTKNGKTIFIDEDQQYFLIESNGNLSVYDRDGFVVTYKSLK